MTSPRSQRIALAVGLGLLVVTLAVVVVLVRSHKGPSSAKSSTAQPSTSSRPGSASPSASSSPTSPTTSPKAGIPTATPTAVPPPTNPPAPPPPPPLPPAYAFAPPFAGGTTATSTNLVAADLSGGRTVTASFGVSSPGPVFLHGFGSIAALIACLDNGQGCAPGQIPNPGYWTLSADDLAHSTSYTVRVSLPGGSAGLDIGWNGPNDLAMSNLGMSGACSTGGYQLGCGVRFRVTTAGLVPISASPGKFHTKARDKAAGTVVPASGDIGFTGSTALALPNSGAWTIYLWSDGPTPANTNLSWP